MAFDCPSRFWPKRRHPDVEWRPWLAEPALRRPGAPLVAGQILAVRKASSCTAVPFLKPNLNGYAGTVPSAGDG